ncbi:MAG: polyamine aminopropyltransferase [Geminicoccaceae bacterium]
MSWVREAYYPSWQQSLRMDREVFRQQSPHQEILIFDNADLGRVLMLDGLVQATERDEFIYHESLVNLAWASHPAARRALVIGGGDGGCLRELVRHADLEAIDLVEIDAAVIDASRRHLPSIHRGAFDDRRVRTVIDDGAAFLERSGETYDLVLVDAPDPVGAGAALFTETFYRACRRCLGAAGVLAAQFGNPLLDAAGQERCAGRLAMAFPAVAFALAPVATYLGGALAIALAGEQPPVRRRDPAHALRWYDAERHDGMRLLGAALDPGPGSRPSLPGRPAGPAHALPAMQTH